jgi:hypothetical protein
MGKRARRGRVDGVVRARERGELDRIAMNPRQEASVGAQQTHCAVHDCLEYRLDIRLRLADDTQNVTGRCLLVERRGQVAVARLEFGEQPHVLDGDDGLVGEGLQQLCLCVYRVPGGRISITRIFTP